MLPVIMNQAIELLRAQGAALVVRDPQTGEAINVLSRGEWSGWTGARVPPGTGITWQVLETGRPYLNNDVLNDPLLSRSDRLGDLRAAVCVPLIAQGQTVGALWVGRRTDISDDELRLVIAMGDIAANALHRAQIVETLEQRVAERTQALADANERLTELDRLKTKFVSDVSHELRTPVGNLKLHLDLLERGKPEKREHYLSVLQNQIKRLAQLVEGILDLSRLERDRENVVLQPVNLNALVEQVVITHQPSAEAAGLSLTSDLSPNLPSVLGEPRQIIQVITNLLSNAINYTPEGSVRVSTVRDGRLVCLQVSDTGQGLDPEDMPHLFERFYRGKHTGQSDIPGSGLGLAIVKEIVDLHGGRIEVDSRAGEGSTFRVWLPIDGNAG
jgi:signal transduction histidine kinase